MLEQCIYSWNTKPVDSSGEKVMIDGTLRSRRSAVLLTGDKALRMSHLCAIPHMRTYSVAAVCEGRNKKAVESRQNRSRKLQMRMINNLTYATAYDSPDCEVAALQQSTAIASRSCFETVGGLSQFCRGHRRKMECPPSP